MMKKKQELFDPSNKILSDKIMKSNNPSDIKKFGRSVKNFNQDTWDSNKFDIMVNGLKLKFSQNSDIKAKLKETSSKKLYEASPYDRIWGTGFDKNDTIKKILENNLDELGQNLLGKALEKVRSEL
jgi:ribA/ribD-fused uncharacterized protein